MKKKLLSAIKRRVGKKVWNKWFSTFEVLSISEKGTTFSVGNLFIKDWLEEKYGKAIKSAVKEVFGKDIEFKVVYKENPLTSEEEKKEKTFPKSFVKPPKDSNLNPDFTFSSFVVGSGNETAFKFAKKVAMEPGRFSPIFIYGGVGVGKTHLVQAIGNYTYSNKSEVDLIYLTSERFMNEMIKYLRENKMEKFREKYRNVDIFIVDDVQFLTGKNGVQFELFNTFNELMDKKKQLIFCSDRSPSDLKDFQDRLVSRFKMGIVIEMRLPDVETRKRIARKIAEREGGNLDEELLDFLAENIDGSLRELRGAIIKLIAYQEIEGKKVGIVEAINLVSSFLKKANAIDPGERLVSVLSGMFDTSPSMIRSRSRKANIVMARELGIFFARKYLKMTVRETAKFFGRSPSVISTTTRKVEEKIKDSPSMKSYLNKILAHISPAVGKFS
ncbi:MAG: chromosomal replication initiator protein DnaA [Thermotogaceae bacterium]|nr:chromosomal replication initiator protein DnaA [Thermotogaceae bacterium]